MNISITSSINQKLVDDILRKMGKIRQKFKKGHTITTGIHSREGSQNKIGYDLESIAKTLAEIMVYHEFGTGRIPKRSWLRSWFDTNKKEISSKMVSTIIRASGIGKDIENTEFKTSELNALAIDLAKWLVRWVEQDQAHFQALRDKTITKKHRAGLSSPESPLIAVKQFLSAIYSKVDGKYAE